VGLAAAVAWNSSGWQFTTICGPVVGGLLYGVVPELPFAAAGLLWAVSLLQVLRLPAMPRAAGLAAVTWKTLSAGFRYIWQEKVVLGAITLDLFAVLLGGATALLPVFARDVLDLGPWALGMLRSAPGIGALTVSVGLAGNPLRHNAGLVMMTCVAL